MLRTFLMVCGALTLTHLQGYAQEKIFSGPQPGEKLPTFKVRGHWGDDAGKELDFVKQAAGKPIVLIFIPADFNRPNFMMTRTLSAYTMTRAKDGLHTGVILLADNPTEAEEHLKRWGHALTREAPLGISLDGREGPGSYGLNRNVNLTILVGKDRKVTASFALVQPSVQADLPKILEEVAKVAGGPVAKIEDLPGLQQFLSKQPPARPAKVSYGKVELLRDPWGVPHVFSDTDAGAMYGLGWAVAEDRGFQMYYSLRIIQGRLAELLGDRPPAPRKEGDRPSQRKEESALGHDKKMRTFGWYRAAKALAPRLDADTLGLLEAYSQGINDYFAQHRRELHPLFAKLDLQPEPWTPADCIASWWHLAQYFANDGTGDLANYRGVVQGTRPAAAPDLPADDSAAVVLEADVSRDWIDRVVRFQKEHGLPASGGKGRHEGPKFSHAWVVGGKKTSTGAAVLVSDPQTLVRNPSLWYEYHVSGKTMNARGIGVSGSPGLLIGWNEHLAWGGTALGSDQADLFRLKTDPAHPNQYMVDGKWRDMDVRRETIRVKGGQPVEIVVRQTHYGPVVTPYASPSEGDPEVAQKRVPICNTDRETIQGTLAMMRATDIGSFRKALTQWDFPSINLIFGDRKGNIGYQFQAAIPIRSKTDVSQGAVAVDGSDSRNDWRGFVPHDLLPHVINPARGWIGSGNHRPVASFYTIPLGPGKGHMGHTLRSWRVYERLQARDRFEPADVLDIHYDTVNPARRDTVGIGLHLLNVLKRPLSADTTAALKQLESWHQRGAKSDLLEDGAALACEINTEFRPRGTPLAGKFGGGDPGHRMFLGYVHARLAKDRNADISADEQSWIDNTLADAWRSAKKRYGADPAQWKKEALAQVQKVPRGYLDSLDGFGSLDPAHDQPTPGITCVDGSTVKSQSGQSYTQYVPLHDVDSAKSLLPFGPSERPGNPWLAITRDLWATGELHPAPLSRKAVEKVSRSTTVLAK